MSTYTTTYLLGLYRHLTDRDRHLLALLEEHHVLTTGQIHRLQYRAKRTCEIRLQRLHELGFVDRFRFARTGGGSDPWHWTLGIHGARLRAGTTGRTPPTERAHRDHILRLTGSPLLAHQLATNEFGVRLAVTAAARPGAHLTRWWSERTATARYLRRIRPDAHGVWTDDGRHVGWFLETDMGSEALHRVTAKLAAYEDLAAAGGPRYPVLIWLNNPGRETRLHDALRRARPGVPVATAVHDAEPGWPVWLPVGGWERLPLSALPSDHGRDTPGNPNWRDGELDLAGDAWA